MKRLFAIALFMAIVLTGGIAAAGEFPAGLEFLGELPIILQGECVVKERSKTLTLPCHIRARNLNNGGQELFYFLAYDQEGKLYGISSFRITDEKDILAAPLLGVKK